ncbi:hypothetical protein [Zavarzinia sp. CC-PAN008]|uniref:hypothetical protein n=1 Tax=Zavarzinia sp. CC-PAN008 TaxID=3243332 RepID=UPI003F7470A6
MGSASAETAARDVGSGPSPNPPARNWPAGTWTGCVAPGLVACGVWACLADGLAVPLLPFVIATLLTALPIWLVAAWLSALRRAHDLLVFADRSRLRLLLSGRLRDVVYCGVALASGASICLSLVGRPETTIPIAALTLGLVLILARVLARRFRTSIAANHLPRIVIPPTVFLSGLCALALAMVVRAVDDPGTVGDAVGQAAAYAGPSAVLRQTFAALAIGEAVPALLTAQFGFWGRLAATLLFEASVWFGIASGLALALVPVRGLTQILAVGGQARPIHFAVAGFLAAIICLALVSGAADLEGRLARYADQPQQDRLPLPTELRTEIEAVNGRACPVGTIERIRSAQGQAARVRADLETLKPELRTNVRAVFAAIRSRIPQFLDWYYSLTAEYLRTYEALVGNGEAFLLAELTTRLDIGSATQPMLAQVQAANEALDRALAAQAALSVEVGQSLDRCTDIPPGQTPVVVARLDEPHLVPRFEDALSLKSRLVTAGLVTAGGVVAEIGGAKLVSGVAAKIAAKTVASSAFKAAATALAKTAATKAVSVAGAAVASGAIVAVGCSWAGPGAALCGVVGGLAGGLGAWVATDYAVLKLEEQVSRDAFAAAIAEAVSAEEAYWLTALGLDDPQE